MLHKFLKYDWVLISSVLLLMGISLAVLYSISTAGNLSDGEGISVFWKQVIFSVLGIAAFILFAFSNYQSFKSYSSAIYFGTLLVLILVLIFGQNIRGTAGWINFGFFNVQPVELSKLTLIIFLASFISQKKMELGEIGRLVASLVLCGAMIFLVIEQPDFGSAMVLISIWIGMTLVSGMSKKMIAAAIILGIIATSLTWFQLQPYQKDRVMNLFKPGIDPQGSGYNVLQSIVAVGSGGIIGKGIGHGSQSQLNFLPEKHTDFIFASIAEELGIIGSFLVLGLFLIIFYRMTIIARNAPDNFGYLVTIGVMLMFFVQVLENIGMNIGVMPVTGIPLPFLSYGGSSLIVSLAAVGIVMNVHSRKESVIRSDEY